MKRMDRTTGTTRTTRTSGTTGRPLRGDGQAPARRPRPSRLPVGLVGPLALVGLAALAGCSTYTVVPADREMVPVRHAPEVSPGIYLRAQGDATGWYVPDAVMLELLGAE